MYTQCPECGSAFRVTAEVLKQAAGKVRCGSCGTAFNALAHLSETMPEAKATPAPEADVPELKPDASDDLTAGTPPKTISAEQSAALLKTLDQLAGEDIRIEDTGVEWRVLDVDEDDADNDEPQVVDNRPPEPPADELRFDDNTPLPDDYDVDGEPSIIPDPVIEPVKPPPYEEMQVDLALAETGDWHDLLDEVDPNEFQSDDDAASEPVIAEDAASDVSEPVAAESVQEEEAPDKTIIDELEALPDIEELEASAVAALETDEPLDIDTQFGLQAEAMGIDLTASRAGLDEPEAEADADADADADAVSEELDELEDLVEELELVEEASSDAAESEAPVDKLDRSIEEDLIAAAFETEAAEKEAAAEIEKAQQAEVNMDNVAPEDLSRAGILDEDDYLEPISEDDEAAARAEQSMEEEALSLEASDDDEDTDDAGESDDALAIELDDIEAETDDEPEVVLEDELEAELDDEDSSEAVDLPDSTMALEAELDAAAAALEGQLDGEAAEREEALAEADDVEPLVESAEDDFDVLADQAEIDATAQEEFNLDGDINEGPFDDAGENLEEELEAALEETQAEDFVVPEQSEEEMTVNMMIDQDLLAIAVEDEDGFTSTIVQKQVVDSDDIPEERGDVEVEEAANDDGEEFVDIEELSGNETAELKSPKKSNPMMETIIMEGAAAIAEEDLEKFEADRKAASASIAKMDKAETKKGSGFKLPKWGMIAASVALALILIIQVIHQSREALATSSTFESTVAPIYRAVGSPVTPSWDISGWRFEATKGSTDENDEVLTIYSRIGNRSETELPYPLVHVSLTDRFEEVVGSRVMEPSEYLVDNLDPSRNVAPGTSFNAVIAIETVSENATGFKLNVCYRMASGQLRCAIEDFK